MANTLDLIFSIVHATLLGSVALVALIYSLPILYVRRLQHRNNIFTLNVCLSTILCCLVYGTTLSPLRSSYSFANFIIVNPCATILQALLGIAPIMSLVLVALHRCCSIVYHQKKFFRSKQWVVACLGGQWILSIILCLPFLIDPKQVSV